MPAAINCSLYLDWHFNIKLRACDIYNQEIGEILLESSDFIKNVFANIHIVSISTQFYVLSILISTYTYSVVKTQFYNCGVSIVEWTQLKSDANNFVHAVRD